MTERELFEAALDQEPDDRAAFLDRACAGTPAMRERLEALLARQEQAGSFLEEAAADRTHADDSRSASVAPPFLMNAATGASAATEAAGQVLAGRYKLLEQIGEGGMGTVWLAMQTEPVRRRVAVKLIKPGMDSRMVLSRFEAERQALALMDHPNIAKVLDGGSTEQGRPFFVMEYVKGVPITEYCEEGRLSIAERLELFVPICQAVQHAHQKGIIHRDLKPTNLLICLYDDRPVPKVIDFGLAKAMHQPLTDQTLYTAHGLMLGTPLYMSPEQAAVNNLDVDTRSDIYSLGVVLYELLTGTTPLEKEQLKQASWPEMLRLIKETEPPRPSTRVARDEGRGAKGEKTPGFSRPSPLASRPSEELDWIVMKALDKDRSRRYETANGLARDLERYLRDEPVLACPPSAWYRFRKFARRNRGLLAMGSVVTAAVVLVLASVVSLVVWRLRDREKMAEDRAAEVQQALDRLSEANSLIQSGRSYADGGRWARAHADFNRALELRPDHSLLWFERGSFYARLGLWDEARKDYAQGFELQRPPAPRLWFQYALLTAYAGDKESYQRFCALIPKHFPLEAECFGAENEIARAYTLASFPGADGAWALDMGKAALDRRGSASWNSMALASACYRAGKYEEAIPLLQASLQTNHASWRAHGFPLLAMAYHRVGRHGEAQEAVTSAAQVLDQWSQDMFQGPVGFMPVFWHDWMCGPISYREAQTLINGAPPPEDPRLWVVRGRALAALGWKDQANAACARAVELAAKDVQIRGACFHVYADSNQWDRAAAEHAQAVKLNPGDPAIVLAVFRYHAERGNWKQAEAEYDNVLRQRPKDLDLRIGAGAIYARHGHWQQAVAQYSTALTLLRKDDARRANVRWARVGAYIQLKEDDKALADLQGVGQTGPEQPRELVNRCFHLAHRLEYAGRHQDAVRAYDCVIQLDPKLALAWCNRGAVHVNLRQWDKAFADSSKAIELDPKCALAWINLGIIHASRGQKDKAFTDYTKAIELDPKLALAWYNRANAFVNLGQWDKAIADYSEAGELNPRDAQTPLGRGWAYFNLKQWDKAIADYSRVIELDPKCALAWYNRGQVYEKLGQSDKALEVYAKAIAIDPKDADSHNYSAWLLANHPNPKARKPDKAVELAKRAVELAPKEQFYWQTLGWAQYRAGSWKAAIATLEKVKELGSAGDSLEWFPLAMAHAQLGNKDEARKWFEQAVQWMDKNNPKDEQLHRFRAEAAQLSGIHRGGAPRIDP